MLVFNFVFFRATVLILEPTNSSFLMVAGSVKSQAILRNKQLKLYLPSSESWLLEKKKKLYLPMRLVTTMTSRCKVLWTLFVCPKFGSFRWSLVCQWCASSLVLWSSSGVAHRSGLILRIYQCEWISGDNLSILIFSMIYF